MKNKLKSKPTTVKPADLTDDSIRQPEPKKKGRVIAVILIILITLIAIFAIWFFMNKQIEDQKQKHDTQVQELNKKIQDLQDSLTQANKANEWLSYTDPYEQLTFMYPPDWKLTKKDNAKTLKDYAPDWKGPFVNVTLTSPGGFTLDYQTHISGLGGGCDPETCPNNTLVSSKPVFKLANGAQIYLVEYEIRDSTTNQLLSRTIGLMDQEPDGNQKIESYKGFPPYVLFTTQGADQSATAFVGPRGIAGGVQTDINYRPDLTAAQYFALPDLVTASKILQTVKNDKK